MEVSHWLLEGLSILVPHLCWKQACVPSISKKASFFKPSKYHPIALTCTLFNIIKHFQQLVSSISWNLILFSPIICKTFNLMAFFLISWFKVFFLPLGTMTSFAWWHLTYSRSLETRVATLQTPFPSGSSSLFYSCLVLFKIIKHWQCPIGKIIFQCQSYSLGSCLIYYYLLPNFINNLLSWWFNSFHYLADGFPFYSSTHFKKNSFLFLFFL